MDLYLRSERIIVKIRYRLTLIRITLGIVSFALLYFGLTLGLSSTLSILYTTLGALSGISGILTLSNIVLHGISSIQRWRTMKEEKKAQLLIKDMVSMSIKWEDQAKDVEKPNGKNHH